MNLTIGKAIQIYMVLTQNLDGYNEVLKEQVVFHPFKLGALRLDIAKNANKLKPLIDAFDKARVDLIKEITGGMEELKQLENPDGYKRFLTEMTEMQKSTEEIDLIQFKRNAFNLEVNQISVPALMILEENGLLVD